MWLAPLALWGSLALLTWVYFGYPLLAATWARLRPAARLEEGAWPALVSVGVAVHDGADQLRQRLANVLEQAPPFTIEIIVASDGSTDATRQIARSLAATDERIKVLDLPRSGQSAAQMAVFDAARGEVVVLTDIETRFAPGCLAALVAPFSDPRVGCTTGILSWRYGQATSTARHEGLYWRYELAVRAWESRAGWLSAGTGALLAVRRSIYRPVPAHASLDQMLPLIARESGKLVLVAPGAVGTDRGTVSLADQFAGRTRIATQGIEANLRMSLHIPPWRRPGSFLAIWSHKLLRWATPFIAMLAVLGGIALWLDGRSVAYLLPAGLIVLGGLLALVGYLAHRIGRNVPLTSFALTILVVNLAFALAWLNVLARRRVGAWEREPS